METYSSHIQKQTFNYIINYVFEKKDVETANELMSLIIEEKVKMHLTDLDLSQNYLKALFVYQRNLNSDNKSDFDFVSETWSIEMIEDLKAMDLNDEDEDGFLLL